MPLDTRNLSLLDAGLFLESGFLHYYYLKTLDNPGQTRQTQALASILLD